MKHQPVMVFHLFPANGAVCSHNVQIRENLSAISTYKKMFDNTNSPIIVLAVMCSAGVIFFPQPAPYSLPYYKEADSKKQQSQLSKARLTQAFKHQ